MSIEFPSADAPGRLGKQQTPAGLECPRHFVEKPPGVGKLVNHGESEGEVHRFRPIAHTQGVFRRQARLDAFREVASGRHSLRRAMELLDLGRVGDYLALRLSDPTYLAGLALLPGVAAGVWLAGPLRRAIPAPRLRTFVLALSGASGLALILA